MLTQPSLGEKEGAWETVGCHQRGQDVGETGPAPVEEAGAEGGAAAAGVSPSSIASPQP